MSLLTKTIPQLTAHTIDLIGSELLEISIGGVSRRINSRQLVLPIDSLITVMGMGGSLPGSRQLVAGAGIVLVDNGAGGTLEITSTGGGGILDGVQDVELAADTDTIPVTIGTGYLNVQPDIPLTLGGLTAAYEGQMVIITNSGFGSLLTLSSNGLGGTPSEDRFRLPDDIVLLKDQSMTFKYSLTMQLWIQA